jgi:hypothetical protein
MQSKFFIPDRLSREANGRIGRLPHSDSNLGTAAERYTDRVRSRLQPPCATSSCNYFYASHPARTFYDARCFTGINPDFDSPNILSQTKLRIYNEPSTTKHAWRILLHFSLKTRYSDARTKFVLLGDFAVTFRPFFPFASAGSFINYDRDSPSLRTVFRFNGCDIEHRGLKSEHMVI